MSGTPFAPRDERGRSLAQVHAEDGPGVGSAVRIITGCESGVSARVLAVHGRTVVVRTASGRRLAYGRSELAPIAPTYVPAR